jgi:hypothetical protein
MAQRPISGPGPYHCEVMRNEALPGRMISSSQGGQTITLHKFLIIPVPPTRILWQLDQQRHLVTKQGIRQETWPLNFAYTASLHS